MNNTLQTFLSFPITTAAALLAGGLTAQITVGGGGPLPPFDPISISSTGAVHVLCTPGDDVVTIGYGATGTAVFTVGTTSATYDLSQVVRVHVYGGDGHDSIRNDTSIPSDFDGGNGNDYLQGGSGADRLVGGDGIDIVYGGAGNDEIHGSDGGDYLYGEGGDDVLHGNGGPDTIRGGDGRDSIFAGSGNDIVHGDAGQDLIVTVGGGIDTIHGGHQWDNFWLDVSDSILDASSHEQSLGYVHVIHAYMTLQCPTATFTPHLEPNGQSYPDPMPLAGHDVMLQNHADVALFGPEGPDEEDIVQGAVGDCYLMAVLSATAQQQPEEIRKLVAPLGDGTFVVRFFRNGQPRYVRVDADLWIWNNNGDPAYAGLGTSGDVLWVPIVEKAFAFFREEAGTIASIHGGNTSWEHHTAMLGAAHNTFLLPEQPSSADIIAWDQAGRINLITSGTLKNQSAALLAWTDQQLAAGLPVYTGSRSGVSDTMPFTQDNYRRGQHIYHVLGVQRNRSGTPTGLILRDPYGPHRTITDYARIVFHIGRTTTLTY